MSNVCCKEFQGWCKSFTKTEIFLCALQAILLTVFIAFLTFLILHLVVCSRSKHEYVSTDPSVNTTTQTISKDVIVATIVLSESGGVTQLIETDSTIVSIVNNSNLNVLTTLGKGVKCTWTPSQQTKALTHYYENDSNVQMSTKPDNVIGNHENSINPVNIDYKEVQFEYKLFEDISDGIEVNDSRKDFLLALVKIKPLQGITFGCTLTMVNEFWTVTAASCIEAIEEVDSLDSFVMMRGFKDQDQNIQPVVDVMIHPQYQGVNATFDLAALKSEGRLTNKVTMAVTLPTFIDYFIISIGEMLTILGYGKFRNIDKDSVTRTAREVSVHSLPLSQCPSGAGTWAPRHLSAGEVVVRGACGARPLCAGVLRARAVPCNYCAGTPLLRRRVLVGLMSDNRHCGLACEPALFVNVALARDWLDSVLSN